MDAFSPNSPEWAANAIHSLNFNCPTCQALAKEAKEVWLNRRAPVTDGALRRKWQEFYLCECGTPWWGWSSDRPISKEGKLENEEIS